MKTTVQNFRPGLQPGFKRHLLPKAVASPTAFQALHKPGFRELKMRVRPHPTHPYLPGRPGKNVAQGLAYRWPFGLHFGKAGYLNLRILSLLDTVNWALQRMVTRGSQYLQDIKAG
jgi:hypothetical protein